MEAAAIDEMSEGRLLDHVESLAAEKRRCEVEILRAAAQHAYLHDADSLGPAQVPTPGRERAVDLGGGGTPQVTEFAAAELGARLGMSSFSARALIADALDLQQRLRCCGRGWRGWSCSRTSPGTWPSGRGAWRLSRRRTSMAAWWSWPMAG